MGSTFGISLNSLKKKGTIELNIEVFSYYTISQLRDKIKKEVEKKYYKEKDEEPLWIDQVDTHDIYDMKNANPKATASYDTFPSLEDDKETVAYYELKQWSPLQLNIYA